MILNDIHTIGRATAAVSSSPPMPLYELYLQMSSVGVRDQISNPVGELLLQELVSVVVHSSPQAWSRLPWSSSKVRVRRLFPALISFVDDYDGSFPDEYFPEQLTARLITKLGYDDPAGANLRLPDQFRLALEVAADHPIGAAILLHAATRHLARGRDNRAFPELAFELDRRIQLGRRIAPFPAELAGAGDPLGDTYHYWANVTAGMCYACSRGESRVVRHMLRWLFHFGPDLMSLIRQGIFGSVLFAGNHKSIDRMGLRHGMHLGGLLTRSEEARW
jgi:hypothetical protein